jgi:hypothetical protein
MPPDLYQWSLWLSEEEHTAYVTINSSGSGGALHPISFELGKQIREELDKITERTYATKHHISINQST